MIKKMLALIMAGLLLATPAFASSVSSGDMKKSVYDTNANGVVDNTDAGGGSVNDTAYNATTWNGDTTTAASKNALRDKFEALTDPTTLISDTAYDAGTWDADTTHAASKNAIRDKVEALTFANLIDVDLNQAGLNVAYPTTELVDITPADAFVLRSKNNFATTAGTVYSFNNAVFDVVTYAGASVLAPNFRTTMYNGLPTAVTAAEVGNQLFSFEFYGALDDTGATASAASIDVNVEDIDADQIFASINFTMVDLDGVSSVPVALRPDLVIFGVPLQGAGDGLTAIFDTGTVFSVVAGADTACTTTCAADNCVHGWETTVGEVAVACADATADKCLCATL